MIIGLKKNLPNLPRLLPRPAHSAPRVEEANIGLYSTSQLEESFILYLNDLYRM